MLGRKVFFFMCMSMELEEDDDERCGSQWKLEACLGVNLLKIVASMVGTKLGMQSLYIKTMCRWRMYLGDEQVKFVKLLLDIQFLSMIDF